VVREAGRIVRNGGTLMLKVVNGVPIMAAFRDTERVARDGVEVAMCDEGLVYRYGDLRKVGKT